MTRQTRQRTTTMTRSPAGRKRSLLLLTIDWADSNYECHDHYHSKAIQLHKNWIYHCDSSNTPRGREPRLWRGARTTKQGIAARAQRTLRGTSHARQSTRLQVDQTPCTKHAYTCVELLLGLLGQSLLHSAAGALLANLGRSTLGATTSVSVASGLSNWSCAC